MDLAVLAFGFIFGANVAATAVLMVHDTNNIRTLKSLHKRVKVLEVERSAK